MKLLNEQNIQVPANKSFSRCVSLWAKSLTIYALVSLIHKMYLPDGALGRIESLAPSMYTVRSAVLFMLLLELFLHYGWERNYSIGCQRILEPGGKASSAAYWL